MVKVVRDKHLPIPEQYSSFIQEIIDKLLEKSQEARPSIDQILEKPYVKEHVIFQFYVA